MGHTTTETTVASELVEFDLDQILQYSKACKKRKELPENNQNTTDVCVISRVLVCHVRSPVPLDPAVISQYLDSLESKSRNCYEFSTDVFEVRAGVSNTPLLAFLSRQRSRVAKATLLSVNILDEKVRRHIFDEIRFITHRMKKCRQHFAVTRMQWDLLLNTATNMVTTRLEYNVTLHPLFYRYFSSDVSSALMTVLYPYIEALPTEEDVFADSFLGLPIDAHLFYKVITDNTARLPAATSTFFHPQLLTELLPFQRKSVGWLLEKEGVVYDTDLRKCTPVPLISNDMAQKLRDSPEDVANAIYHVISRLCYGWNRVLFKGDVYWVNDYTGNIMLQAQMVEFLLEYYEKYNSEMIPGRGLLSEEMGLGKTVEVMDLVLLNPRPKKEVGQEILLQLQVEGDYRLVRKAKTTLIAAPDSILRQWYSEIAQLCPSLSITIYKGLDKYPELLNVPKYIGEYLQRFDIVLMNYATISREMDYANYSSRHIPTRGGQKRNAETDGKEDGNGNQTLRPTANDFKAELNPPKVETTFSQKKYDHAVMEELAAKVRREDLSTIPHTHFYESPLMMCQWWRVVLDEVQMVSSGASRSFKTAAIIPRFHSWGVSGTPLRLMAVLQFLKVAPFNYDIAKFCWKQLTSPDRPNTDFVRVWRDLSLRHTKAMVHDEIKLPPQQRILLSMPLTKVEQDKYDRMLESTLASIGIYPHAVPKKTEIKLTPSACVHLRQWLVKLRQLCGNLQVGHMPTKAHLSRRKLKNRMFLQTVPELKTLENVLDDMLELVVDNMGECERDIINRLLDICLLLEYVLYPEKVIDIINVVLTESQKLVERIMIKSQQDAAEYQRLRQILSHHGALAKKDMEGMSEDESDEDALVKVKNDDPVDEQQIQAALTKFHKYKEVVASNKMRLRSWKLTQHKCYFLLASAHFQLYDTEYQLKIQNLRISFESLGELYSKVHQNGVLNAEEISLYSGIEMGKSASVDYLAHFKPDPKLSDEEAEIEKNKFLELNYYSLAEECRKEILKHTIKDVDMVMTKRIQNRNSIEEGTWVNDGENLFPKTSKKLFTAIPLIEVLDVGNIIGDMKSRQLFELFLKLFNQLNTQAKIINEMVQNLIKVLCNPLLTSDKSPDGEEYEQSIQDQDQASCFMLVISHLLTDRSNATLEAKTKITEIIRQQDHDYKLESQRVNDKKFLKELQNKRVKAKPDTKMSFEELLQDARLLEVEMRDNYRSNALVEVFEEIVHVLRNVFENEKICQTLLQKELSTSFNAVFNARVEYFKQLQQISDSVQPKTFGFLQEELNANLINEEFQTLFNLLAGARNKLTRSMTRYRYLMTLAPKDEGPKIKQEDEESLEELICIICQSPITVGSLTSCGHKFCKACLDEWLNSGHPWCPLCKTKTDRDTVYYFTHYNPDLKAEAEESVNDHAELESHHHNSIHQVYKQVDHEVLKQIQRIKLSNSYGSKVDMIVKQVLHLRSLDPDVQIVVFSQWQDLLVILAFAFDKANISYVSAKGSHVEAYKNRKLDPVEEFKNRNNIKTCFLLNAQAQASGLTLINATNIFLCEPLVNTPTELQAISRIHRIGQKNVTTVWMFSIQNSVEENIVALGTRKRLEYLKANARENHQQPEILEEMVDDDLQTAESFALTIQNPEISGRSFSGNSESVTDSDLWNVYFGEEETVDKEA